MSDLGSGIDENSPLFAIAVAAELSGMHPQTLRQYDRLGLVSPGRTAGTSTTLIPMMPPPMMTTFACSFMGGALWPSWVRAAIANSGGLTPRACA